MPEVVVKLLLQSVQVLTPRTQSIYESRVGLVLNHGNPLFDANTEIRNPKEDKTIHAVSVDFQIWAHCHCNSMD